MLPDGGAFTRRSIPTRRLIVRDMSFIENFGTGTLADGFTGLGDFESVEDMLSR
jgi:hypothetical protein